MQPVFDPSAATLTHLAVRRMTVVLVEPFLKRFDQQLSWSDERTITYALSQRIQRLAPAKERPPIPVIRKLIILRAELEEVALRIKAVIFNHRHIFCRCDLGAS